MDDPAIRFSKHFGDWVIHITGFLLSVVAIYFFMQSKGWARTAVVVAFAMIMMDDFLMLINLYSQDALKPVLTPIRHNLHLAAIVTLGYIFMRERQEEHERLRQQLSQDERTRAVGQLAAGVAHDFNNLLQVILGYADVARSDSQDSKRALDNISSAGNRAALLVNQLLAFSKVSDDAQKRCEVDAVVLNLHPILAQLVGPKYELILDAEAQDSWVGMSETQLEQVLTNLVVNSRDALTRDGKVELTTRRIISPNGTGNVQITVRDNGIGMDEEERASAFEPYFSTKPVGQGSGLGLATVYGIIDAAGGETRLSSAPGEGTTIEIELPATRALRTTGRLPAHPTLSTALRILVADDEGAVLKYVESILRNMGHTVTTATNGAEAVAKAREMQGQLDLVILDGVMPELDGPRAFEQIRTIYPEMPILFMCGYIPEFEVLGTDWHYIQKPFERTAFLDAVAEAYNEAEEGAPLTA